MERKDVCLILVMLMLICQSLDIPQDEVEQKVDEMMKKFH